MHFHRLRRAARPLPLSFLVVSSALAQQLDGQQAAPPDQVITVYGQQSDAEAAPLSISVIAQADLARGQNGAAADLLARLPGVSVSQNGSLGSVTSVRIRGAEGDQTLVVIDGVRVGDPSSPGGGFDFGSLQLGLIERIELLRGSNSLSWGSQAIGGVVLISTLPDSSNTGVSGRLTSDYGARDTARTNGRIILADDRLGRVSVGASHVRTDGISSAAAGSEQDRFRQYAATLSSAHDLGSGVSLTSFGLLSDNRLAFDGFPPPTFTLDDTDQFQKSREHYAGVTLGQTLGAADAPDFSYRFSASLADINRDTFDPAIGPDPDFAARGRTERLALTTNWNAVPGAVRVLAGAEREWSRALTASAFSADDGRTAISAVHGQALLSPAAGLNLTAGVRHDDHRDFGGATTLAGDASYAAGGGVTLRAAYREGYKAPTLFQLSGSSGGFGNPDLMPERSRSYEAGVRAAGARWSVDAALFRRTTRDLVDFVGCAVGDPAAPAICRTGNRPFGTFDNIGQARARGIEIVASLLVADGLTLTGNYSHVGAQDRTPGSFTFGNRLARRPRDSANAALVWQVPGRRGPELTGQLRYAGASFDDRGNTVRLGDYLLADARLSLPLTDNLVMFARAENLLSSDYQTVAGFGTAGRSAFAGLRWDW